MIEILQGLKNYKSTYDGFKEVEQLRNWSMIISEDIQFVSEYYIKQQNGHNDPGNK